MSLTNLMGILQQYANTGPAQPGTAVQHFEQVAQSAAPAHLAGGLAEAFRSNQTPPFPQMLATLFSNSNGQQQAGILNRLLSSVAPGTASSIVGALSPGSAPSNISPQQAQQVAPGQVQQLAEEAQKSNPSIIDEASEFYAQHPQVIKTLGAASLGFIMGQMSKRL